MTSFNFGFGRRSVYTISLSIFNAHCVMSKLQSLPRPTCCTQVSTPSLYCQSRIILRRIQLRSSLFINTALLLWAFDIREDPASPIDTMGFTDAGNVRALPFKAVFTPRIERLRNIVESHLV